MPPSPWLSARRTIAMYLIDDDDNQRVQDEREHAEDVVVRRRHGMRAEETLANRVEGARPDVAVDDTNRGEREREQRASLVGLAGCRHPSREDSTLDCRRRRDINDAVVRTPSTLPFSRLPRVRTRITNAPSRGVTSNLSHARGRSLR